MSEPDRIDSIPLGIRESFWIVAIGKFMLASGALGADASLRVLKSIHSLAEGTLGGGYFDKEILPLIEPASRPLYDIFDAAMKLGPKGCFEVLTCRETFGILLKLNPSVLKAIEHADERWNRNTVKLDVNGVPIAAVAAPSVASRHFETKPDPRGGHLDESFFRKPSAPQYAKGSQSHPGGAYNIFGGS